MRLIVWATGLFLFTLAAQADWQPAKRLTWNSGDSNVPRIVVDSSGYLHLVWEDNTPGNYDVYYKQSTDGGATWRTSQRLSWTSGTSWSPAMSIDPSGNIHVVWYDNTPDNYEIYYKMGT